MNTHDNVLTKEKVVDKQSFELVSAIMRNLPPDLTAEEMQYWIENKDGATREFLKKMKVKPNIDEQLSSWHRYYKDIYSVDITWPSDMRIPPYKIGFDWIIASCPKIPTSAVWEEGCKKNFTSYYCDFLDSNGFESIIKWNACFCRNDHYIIIRCRDRIEADEEHKGASANDLNEVGINAITLDERLRLESWYWWSTGGKKNGKHLDIKSTTLCAGSRDSDGCVLCVDWRDGRLSVGLFFPGDAFDNLRCREVVSS